MGEAVTDYVDSTTAKDSAAKEAEPFPIRFSASIASRYHNCHGSARLEQAIEGFKHPDRNERGMKGEGTLIHKIFQEVLEQCDDIATATDLLEELSQMHYRQRDPLIRDKKSYIIWYFMKYKVTPTVPWEIVNQLEYTTVGEAEGKEIVTTWRIPPRRVVHMCEALRYVADIMSKMTDPVLVLEKKLKAEWLTTRPSTTADVVLYDYNEMHIMDLKGGDIEVSPMNNEQLMYYLKTWLKHLGRTFKDMRVHILQRNNIDYWPVTNKLLEEWVLDMQKSEAAILDGDLELTPGDHCKFCPANPHGRGDRGTPSCPVMLDLIYGPRDAAAADAAVITEDYEDE